MSERPRVVVGVDGSTESQEALRFALDEAAHRGADLTVVAALAELPHWPEAYAVAGPSFDEEREDRLRATVRGMVDAAVGAHPPGAAVPVHVQVAAGRPAEVLVERARGADLLVVGHRGRGAVASTVLGSVGLQCVLHAPCPVAVVRPVARQPAGDPEPAARGGHGLGSAVVGPLY